MEYFIPYSTLCHESAGMLNDRIMGFQEERKLTDEQLSDYLHTPMSILFALRNNNVYTTLRAVTFFEDAVKGDFSEIKSHIGSSPTLFNSSQTSGFVYRIVGCDVDGMHRLNYKDSFLDIVSGIKEGYALEYAGCRNEYFEQNLRVVDSRMDEILQNAMLLNVGYLEGANNTSIPELCRALTNLNPIGVKNPKVFYEAKLKSFLFASFAGMTASTEWSGRKKLTGGYIDVDRDGELLYYRAISDDIFENYLFKHTYVDRPDRGVCKALAIAEARAAVNDGRDLTNEERNKIVYKDGKSGVKYNKKGDFGYVYQKGDDFYIVINFQIRFS